jgi:hypothetical protein
MQNPVGILVYIPRATLSEATAYTACGAGLEYKCTVALILIHPATYFLHGLCFFTKRRNRKIIPFPT